MSSVYNLKTEVTPVYKCYLKKHAKNSCSLKQSRFFTMLFQHICTKSFSAMLVIECLLIPGHQLLLVPYLLPSLITNLVFPTSYCDSCLFFLLFGPFGTRTGYGNCHVLSFLLTTTMFNFSLFGQIAREHRIPRKSHFNDSFLRFIILRFPSLWAGIFIQRPIAYSYHIVIAPLLFALY